MDKETSYRRLEVSIPEAGARVPFAYNTDDQYDVLTGIYLLPQWSSLAGEGASILKGTRIGLSSNTEVVFREDEMLAQTLACDPLPFNPPDERFFTAKGRLQVPAKNVRLSGAIVDGGNSPEYPYTIDIQFILEKRQ